MKQALRCSLRWLSCLLLHMGLFAATPLPSEVLSVSSVFSDHMVLQRDRVLPVWGRAEPGASVTVRFRSQEVQGITRDDGRWMLHLQAEAASFEPDVLTISSGGSLIVLQDVLIGEVWFCSGQSNMMWEVSQSLDGDLETRVKAPAIRLLRAQRIQSGTPLEDNGGRWSPATPETIQNFSSVGWHFGRTLQSILDVPVGLIDSSWGGTPAISWTRPEAMERHPLLQERWDQWQQGMVGFEERHATWREAMEKWRLERNLPEDYHADPGIAPAFSEAHQPGFRMDPDAWSVVPKMPAPIEVLLGNVDGAFWFRKEIPIPEGWPVGNVRISLGVLDDFDAVWVNGHAVGGMNDPADQPWRVKRIYTVPEEALTGAGLTIAVRIFDRFGAGGFLGMASDLWIGTDAERISLAGAWHMGVERKLEPAPGRINLSRYPDAPRAPQHNPDSAIRPASLAHGMVTPFLPYAMRGVIWYQGESDTGWEPLRYGERLQVMFEDWREAWGIPDLYIGIVQLANFQRPKEEPANDPWPQLREAQRQFALRVPNTGMAVAIDLGDVLDIHPRDKISVGRRLARLALADVYGVDLVRGGPELEQAWFEDRSVLLQFQQVGLRLISHNQQELGGFTLAGEDGVFHPAEATLLSNTQVRVSSDAVPSPVHLRYAWQNNPAEASLFSFERLPATPFEVQKKEFLAP